MIGLIALFKAVFVKVTFGMTGLPHLEVSRNETGIGSPGSWASLTGHQLE
jgi:hypothetical protein